MAEVLRSIVDAPADLNATLQTIIDNAVHLCRTDKGFIYLREGDVYQHTVDTGAPAEVVEYNVAHPIRPSRGTSTGRAVLERRPVHIPDVFEDPEYEYWDAQRLGGFRTLLSVPMFYQDDVVGVVSVYRSDLRPFSDSEIDLLAMFADQASLAYETSRLVAIVDSQRTQLARYLPSQVAELVSSPDGERLLEGHRSEITVVFTDLRGFTAFAAGAEPEEVIAVLGEYHQEMGRIVVEHDGTLSGFFGDGLMIYFNDPVPMPDHARRAIAMAERMQDAFGWLSARWHRRGFDLGLGIGIATGYATLGRIGYQGRHDYGPIGTVVNLASRLCGEASSGAILASQPTLAAANIEDAPAVGPMQLKGFAQPVVAYQVPMTPEPEHRSPDVGV